MPSDALSEMLVKAVRRLYQDASEAEVRAIARKLQDETDNGPIPPSSPLRRRGRPRRTWLRSVTPHAPRS